MTATCETKGHLYGAGESCMFCGVLKPEVCSSSIDQLAYAHQLADEHEAEKRSLSSKHQANLERMMHWPEIDWALKEIDRLRKIEIEYNQECAAADEQLPVEEPAPVSKTMVERLRDLAKPEHVATVGDLWNICDKAADEIEHLLDPANREPPHCSSCACGLPVETRECNKLPLRVVIDSTIPPDTIEFRRPDGALLGTITNLATETCEDCPPIGYPTDKTRCAPCPRRAVKATGDL